MRSNVLSEYASACQFLARLASGIFLTGFEDTFSTTCDYQTMAKLMIPAPVNACAFDRSFGLIKRSATL